MSVTKDGKARSATSRGISARTPCAVETENVWMEHASVLKDTQEIYALMVSWM